MSIPFTGRKTELDHVQQLINDKQGAVFAITGKSGMGKSTLLLKIKDSYPNKGRVFIDMNYTQPFQTAVLFLQYFAEHAEGLKETQKALAKINGTYKNTAELSAPYEDILKTTVELGFKEHSEELELTDDEKGKLITFTKIGVKLFGIWSKNGQEKAKAKLGDPELVLLKALKQDCKNQPLILIDTYERLHAAQELCQQKIASRYAKPHQTLMPIEDELNFQNWLEFLVKFLKQHGAIVIVAGRKKMRDYSQLELECFNDDDIANAVAGSGYTNLQALLTDDAQAAALFNIINRLSFNGIPLWLQLALNFLNAKLNEGYDIHELAAMSDIQQLFSESEDSRDLNTDNIDNARCKLALFKRVMQHNLALEEQTWRMALPRRLDKDVLTLLYAEQANSMREAFNNMGLLKTEKGINFLHEEIRDLLLAYARHKNWLKAEETSTLHQQLADCFKQRYQNTNCIEDLLESLYHQLMNEEQTQLDTIQDTELLYNMALQLEAKKHYAQMSQVFLRLIAIQPEHENSYYSLGVALGNIDKLDEAVAVYQQQLCINPNHEVARNNLGMLLTKQGKLDEAIAAYQQLSINPNNEYAWYDLGEALRGQGKFDEAIEAYQQQLNINPNHETGVCLGFTLGKQGKFDEAIAAYRQFPNSEGCLYNLGVTLCDLGKLGEAITTHQQLLTINPNYKCAWYNLGVSLGRQGKFDEAIAAYQQELRINPNYEAAQFALGWTQRQLAQQIFAHVLSLSSQQLSALNNDAELALVQENNAHCLVLIQSALALVTNKNQESVILQFLAWIVEPEQTNDAIYAAIQQLDPSVKIDWDFSDTEPVIARLKPETQGLARQFIAYFQGVGELP